MNPIRQRFNRPPKLGQSSPAPPPYQGDPTSPSISTAESWTTHNSNLALLECLSIATRTRPALPAELILKILQHPTRWVHLHSISHSPLADPDKPIVVARDRPTGQPVLYTRPFSAQEVHLLRKVVFTFRSRDQGWCSSDDKHTWSWFEASLVQLPSTDENGQRQDNDIPGWTGSYEWVGEWMERHEKRLESQPRYRIQSNRLADTTPMKYTIELAGEHELVQRVKEGDRVILWACACFRGWENRVYEAKISILGFDDLTMERETGGQ